ncbi:sulfotransferase family protein [Duganella qianjiadongensis]|uniref:Sulfotransferase n=1 Tax=Duganella qianjiadongensis TaxID=2692176 RepID=A0ABW9VMG5_9BURK|nr:sulfotransferase [Duganella qianjiadongensis]MYM39805.1 sulfotransferase [Duganella qianjiadongensis]
MTPSPRPRPVMMIPLRRCGSHALRLRLNMAPQFYSPYPLHIVDFMPLLPLYGDLHDDRHYFRLVSDLCGLQAVSMVKWPHIAFDPVEIFEAIRHQPRSVHRVHWELLMRAASQHGASVVMDKSLDNVHYADELMALFPDMLFVNVVRDPRAQVASMNRAIIHDFDSQLNAQTWLAAHRAADHVAAQYPDRVLTIRYEDFLASQQTTLEALCGFLGIDFLPQMLDVGASQEARQIAQLSSLWSSNCYPPIVANIDKFKQQLSMDEINVIESLTGAYMDRYGYPRLTAGNADLTPATQAQAKQRSDACRTRAWHDLEHDNFRDYVLRRCRADYLAQLSTRLNQQALQPDRGAPPVTLNELDPGTFEVTD